MSQSTTEMGTIKVTVTIDAELLKAIDTLTSRFPDLGRNEVIGEALRKWYRREQATAERFTATPSPEEQAESGTWPRIQATAAERIFRSR